MPAPATLSESIAPPKQARSEQTMARLLEAAEALILERGVADVSISEIVQRARSSVGGFYARFRDKRALLRALEDRFLADVTRRLEALANTGRWADASLAEIVDTCAGELVTVTSERRNLIAAFLLRAAGDATLWADGLRFRRRVEERFAELLRGRSNEVSHPEPELAVHLGVQFAFGLVIQRVLTGDVAAAGRVLSDAELRCEITRNFLAYLGAPAAIAAPSSSSAARPMRSP
jgi:AcrR family transcriptional regulator